MKQILQLTALSTAIALVGCGGGGGGGFYGPSAPTTTPTTTPAASATNYHIVLTANKPTMVATGDTAVVTVKLVDVNGGGVAGQTVTLSIPDTTINGVTIDGASKATTDETGNATFTIKLPATANPAVLIASGITVNASFTDTTGKVTTQKTLINVVQALTSSTSTAQYHLAMSSNKPTLIVTGDNAIVTVKAVDENGGGVSGQTIVLSIPNTVTNGATINGASTAITDLTGNATFTLLLPAASSANQAALIAQDLTVNASLTDVNGVTTKQTTLLDIVPTAVAVPVANITFGNSGLLETSADGTFYTESLSANVVDIDGKPIKNTPVVMTIDLLGFEKGSYFFDKNADPATRFYANHTNCPLSPPTPPSFVQIATTFVAPTSSTDGTVTYTTDSTGKFDFKVRFLRRFATWQTVDITAKVTVGSATVTGNLPYTLSVLKPDFDNPAGQPFDVSPYGMGPSVLGGAPSLFSAATPPVQDPNYSAKYNLYLNSPEIINKQSYPSAPDSREVNYVTDYSAYRAAVISIAATACTNQN